MSSNITTSLTSSKNTGNIRVGIVNEGATDIERLAAKVIGLPADGCKFIKLYPSLTHRQNRAFFNNARDEYSETHRMSHLGISFVSYSRINYLEFYSSLKSFALCQGEEITIVFDEREMTFNFTFPPTTSGYLKCNKCAISDEEMQFIAENPVSYWKLKKGNTVLFAGFEHNAHNKQYRSKIKGQNLLQETVQGILILKRNLKAG